MAMRVSGINSGLDTDAIVQELVSAYSKKTEKYEKAQTKLSWKQEAWKSLNSKVYSLYTNVSKMKYSSAYAAKKVSSSDTTKAAVTASGAAVNGTQKMNVLRTAQSAYLTGGKISSTLSGGKVTSETTLKDLGYTEESTLRVKTTDSDGKEVTKDIKFTKDSTIADVTKELANAGLNASFDENNGRFYISSKNSGAAGDFTITAADTKKVPKMVDGQVVKDENGKPVYEEIAVKDSELAVSNRLLGVLGLGSGEYQSAGAITTNQGKTATVKNTMANLGYGGGETTINVTAKVNGKEVSGAIDIKGTATIEDVITQFKEMGINANFDSVSGKLTFEGAEDLKFTAPDVTKDDGTIEQDANSLDIIKRLGLNEALKTDKSKSPIKIDGQDAMIVLNGVMYTSDTNNFSINGLNITANGVTDDLNALTTKIDENGNEITIDPSEIDLQALQSSGNAITISVSTDTQGLYDTIKDFLTEYNNIINEITKLYNADSASDYEPLTDEEKDAMSDTEIEKWETKIKDSLLRRDSSLSAIMTSMMNAMNQGIEVNGKTYALSSFGIHTMGYLNAAENEQNAFHIDGDEDDENTSGNEDKLMKALTEDADTVIEFMKQLSSNLYKAIDDNMQSSSLRSRYKIYNDKELDTQYNDYTKLISNWEDKVSEKEEYYYSKFTSMETALSKINSQTSSLSGLLGM